MGSWSIINGRISSTFLVLTSFCFFLPTSFDANMEQTWENFNYTIVVFTVALVIAGTYWNLPKSLGGAKHFFTGPIRPGEIIQSLQKEKSETITEPLLIKHSLN